MVLSKTKRRVIFYSFFLIFIIVTPLLILYARGFYFLWGSKVFIKTGGVFLKSSNENSLKISVGDNLVKETSFLSKGAIVSPLNPGEYKIRVEKDGFSPWEKKMKVREETMTEVRNILLIPDSEKINARIIAGSSTTELSLMPLSYVNNKIVVRDRNGGAILLVNNDDSTKKLLPLLPNRNYLEIKWAGDASRILARDIDGGWFLKKIGPIGPAALERNPDTRLKFPKFIESQKTSQNALFYDFFPDDYSKFFGFADDKKIYEFEIRNNAIIISTSTPALSNVNSYKVTPIGIFALFENGFFGKYDYESRNIGLLGRKGVFLSDKKALIGESAAGDVYLIDASGGLYLARNDDMEIRTVDGGVLGAEFDNGARKLLYWKENEIRIILLENEKYQPHRTDGSIIAIPTVGEKIKKASWYDGYDNEHILVLSQNGIFITDIDDRGGFFSTKLMEPQIENFFYDPGNQKIYWDDYKMIYEMDF